jgi:hypothetical protein
MCPPLGGRLRRTVLRVGEQVTSYRQHGEDDQGI